MEGKQVKIKRRFNLIIASFDEKFEIVNTITLENVSFGAATGVMIGYQRKHYYLTTFRLEEIKRA